jgi:hypothetical protein
MLVCGGEVDAVKVKFDTSSLGLSKWYEYVIRFVFGGTITALTGIIARRYGPEIGGLFLAFPAILPAAASLIEKHEKEKKERAGLHGTMRGRVAAGIDAVDCLAKTPEFLVGPCAGWGRAAVAHSICNGVGTSGNVVPAYTGKTWRGFRPQISYCSTTWPVNS